MIKVSLPDGSERSLDEGASVADLASQIGPGLAKAAVAAKINSKTVDLNTKLAQGDQVQILTKRDPEALDILRHSAAHLMADAVLRVFPGAELTIGPTVEDGFYYDFHMKDGKITPDDFAKIEAEMKKIVAQSHPFQRSVSEGNGADEVFKRYEAIDGGSNKFKQEIVEGLRKKPDEELSFYRHGDFVDLCRGPHVPHTGWLAHVKLTKVSGSYWRADASREQLTRVYGTAFFGKKELKEYLNLVEEAKKRDHRILGEQLDLFVFDEDAPGFPFFMPKGTALFNSLMSYMRTLLSKRNYLEVKTPLILSEALWHKSGHYDNYLENMFFTKLKLRDKEDAEKIHENVEEDRPMAVKPMNCPGHLVVYKSRQHSHNQFPLRIAEMGLVHRRELSGVRHGLFRVQAFTQDDAHHFCTPEQIGSEIKMLVDFFKEVYTAFGLSDVRIELSTRPEKSIGSDEMWERAESSLKQALDEKEIPYDLNEGDGAFYGPKIDFHIRDVLKRSWQCGTIQLDFSMPERFGLSYIGADGGKHTPVMIHRACYGSLERFLGIVIENYAGKFPFWIAPTQIMLLPISAKYNEYAEKVALELRQDDLRVELNLSDDRVGYKIRAASMQKLPYIIVLGEKEKENKTVNVRSRDEGELGEMSLVDFKASLQKIMHPAT